MCSFIKNEALAQVFSCEFWKIRKNTFFAEHHETTASDYSSINCQLISQSNYIADVCLG